jgi:putative ABC transport system substrate-binding protein
MNVEMLWLRMTILLAVWCCLPTADVRAATAAPGMHRIGFVNVGPPAPNAANLAAFKAGLADLGYVEGRNLVLDVRWGNQRVDQLPELVDELIKLKPALIVSTGGPVTARSVLAATQTVPVVFITGNPVAEGLVQSLARPGGNATGLAVLATDLEPKRLEILRELAPRAKRIALLRNPKAADAAASFRDTEAAAARLGLTLLPWQATNLSELKSAFSEIAEAKPDALFVSADVVLGFERAHIVEFARASRLPSIYFWREFVDIGGLASYATSLTGVYRRSAHLVDRILKGSKPGELPIEQPTTFELIINLKTARELGLVVSPLMRQRADEVIE